MKCLICQRTAVFGQLLCGCDPAWEEPRQDLDFEAGPPLPRLKEVKLPRRVKPRQAPVRPLTAITLDMDVI